MKKNIVGRSTVAIGPSATVLVCVPVDIIPQALMSLDLKSLKYWYASPEDWARGRSLLAYLGASMLLPCGQEIVNAVDRLYVSFEAHVAGVARTATPSGTIAGAFDYAPALEQEANPLDVFVPSLRVDAQKSTALLDNLITGATSLYASDPDAIKQLIRDLIAKVEASSTDSEGIKNILNAILLALG